MCSPIETKAMVYEAFEEEGGLKDQMREQHQADINAAILKLIGVVGLAFIGAIIGFTMYLNTIANKVETLDEFAKSGERFTQNDGQLLKLQIQANQQALSNSASSKEVQELKEAFIRLDERLRNKGI